jgi:hypothetical protein
MSVSHTHADRGKINEESVDAAAQKTPNFRIQIAMRRRRAADLQIVGKKLVLGAKSPHMDLEIHRMSGAYALGRG